MYGPPAAYPVDQVAVRKKRGEPKDFHIGGSDASGIVYAVRDNVNDIEIGQHAVVHPGVWDADDPWIKAVRIRSSH
jgi:crotonyl-CoA carboxylase/reductase